MLDILVVEDNLEMATLLCDFLKAEGYSVQNCTDGESALFTGDTVFAGSVGRTDFTGGSYEELSESVNTIKQLERDLPIYPGHGPASTIGEEIKSNPYFT